MTNDRRRARRRGWRARATLVPCRGTEKSGDARVHVGDRRHHTHHRDSNQRRHGRLPPCTALERNHQTATCPTPSPSHRAPTDRTSYRPNRHRPNLHRPIHQQPTNHLPSSNSPPTNSYTYAPKVLHAFGNPAMGSPADEITGRYAVRPSHTRGPRRHRGCSQEAPCWNSGAAAIESATSCEQHTHRPLGARWSAIVKHQLDARDPRHAQRPGSARCWALTGSREHFREVNSRFGSVFWHPIRDSGGFPGTRMCSLGPQRRVRRFTWRSTSGHPADRASGRRMPRGCAPHARPSVRWNTLSRCERPCAEQGRKRPDRRQFWTATGRPQPGRWRRTQTPRRPRPSPPARR